MFSATQTNTENTSIQGFRRIYMYKGRWYSKNTRIILPLWIRNYSMFKLISVMSGGKNHTPLPRANLRFFFLLYLAIKSRLGF